MKGNSRPQRPNDQDNLISALNIAIDGISLAKDAVTFPGAGTAFGAVSCILAMVRDAKLNEEEYVTLGILCARVCIALNRGLSDRPSIALKPSISGAIADLTTTVEEIQKAIHKLSGQKWYTKFAHSKISAQKMNGWRSELGRILDLFNAEIGLNTHGAVAEMADVVRELREAAREMNEKLDLGLGLIAAQAQEPEPAESPPPEPRACIGRDDLIEKLVCRAENLEPSALIGAGGTGKTAVALTVLHHKRVVQKFADQRRFIRCDEFPTSIVNFLDRLSAVIGAGIKNVTSLAPLRPHIAARPMLLVLDNAETILDPQARDADAISLVIEELGRFPALCLIITSRISTIPSDCERIDIPPLSGAAAQAIFYRIYRGGERSKLVDDLLERLDFHPLSITILATAASRKSWDYGRILEEWEKQKVKVLQTGHRNQSLAATIEVSLDSPTFRELGPQAREILGVAAFFPQGIDEKNLEWLFPDIPDRGDIIDGFCMLSLTSHYKGFVTMLAPLRDYLHPKDLGSPSLMWEVKGRYFAKLHLVDEKLKPGSPGFEATKWILRENSNVERLLEEFVALDEESESVWEAYADFLLHLSWHKPALVVPEAGNDGSSGARKRRKQFLSSFGKRMKTSFSDNLLGQKVINRFDRVLSDDIISGEEFARCLQILCRMCDHQRTIPESMHIAQTDTGPDGVVVASGGFSSLHLGEHEGRPVAVKVMRIRRLYTDIEVYTSKFYREAVIWKHLRHPNILPFIGVKIDLKKLRLAMVSEWMANGTINEFIRNQEGVNRAQLLVDVANGLEYMHSLRVVHGDLKGNNILINDRSRACIADFGFSTGVGGEHHATSNGSLMPFTRGGTLQFMSPELLVPKDKGADSGRQTKESDCYALGMVIYQVLCGTVPFPDLPDISVLFHLMQGRRPLKPEGAEKLGCTDELWGMLEHCWRLNPDERPGVREVLRCLENAAKLEGWDKRPLPAAPVTDGRSFSEDSGPNPFLSSEDISFSSDSASASP